MHATQILSIVGQHECGPLWCARCWTFKQSGFMVLFLLWTVCATVIKGFLKVDFLSGLLSFAHHLFVQSSSAKPVHYLSVHLLLCWFPFISQVRLTLGMYVVFLLDWLTTFQREQILVLRLEDYAADLKETMKKIFDFLSVGACPKSYWKHRQVFVGKPASRWFCTDLLFPHFLQDLCQSRWRRHWQRGPCPTPAGHKTGVSVPCFQLPETSSWNFTNPSIMNWPLCWTTRPSSGATAEGTQ